MYSIACPLCQERDPQQRSTVFTIVKTTNERYEICRCHSCQMVYTYCDREVDPAELYDQNDYTVKDTRSSIFFKIQKWEYTAVIRYIKLISGIETPSIMDFGSGKGLFLHFADLERCIVKGIESSKPRAQYAKEYFGLDINTEYYSSGMVFKRKFDVLTTFHVLEHLQNPGVLLHNLVRSNLKEKGLLVVEVPNYNSWQSAWAGNTWLHLDVPRHIGHFTPESLEKVVKESGCRIVKKQYFSIHLGIIGMLQTIFSWFGYKGFLIAELKLKRNKALLLKISLVLPLAILLEGLAVLFNKGGILRYYAIHEPKNEG
jgi:2-polyprenyl-3-methyl-5-hydroxy-6-metoxy-1,4-benzoquinol methylase